MDIDGADLGEDFFLMRDHHPAMLAFNRYALDWQTGKILQERPLGWQWTAFKLVARYWLDLPWRFRTSRDRRLTWGRGLIGMLRRAMLKQNIPLVLNTKLVGLDCTADRLDTVIVEHHGTPRRVRARRGVVLAAGGFEQNQAMRDEFMQVKTIAEASLAPKDGNKGDAIRIAQEIGAAVENMGSAWWTPSMRMPSRTEANVEVSHPLFFERAMPGSLCVNRLGRRFVNEAITYERFGRAMINDQVATGANTPCWMIFDAGFRKDNAVGGLMPASVVPDRKIPDEWWDNVLFRASSIAELAAKIGVDPKTLAGSVEAMNGYAQTGKDTEFGRGDYPYDKFWGAKNTSLPNNCLGPIAAAPFYAIRIDLGDLGTNGGLKVDHNASVIDRDGKVIEGLYATGNTIGSIFGSVYPGGGVTLGQTMTYGYIAANQIASTDASV
jgi:3-oxosteroid 1-dehydrogenase